MLSLARRLRLPVFVVLLAALAVIFAPTAPAGGEHEHGEKDKHAETKHDDHAKKQDDHGKHDDHAAHKEPTAIDHVMDAYEFHVFDTLWPQHIELPTIFGFRISKFMVLEVIAALLVMACYIPLARSMKEGHPPRGWIGNALEVLLTFVRDQIAKPNLGEDIADRYVPFLWTLFLFILFNNLLGMFPFLGSATASVYVTGALALIVFFAIHGSAIVAMGQTDPHAHGHGDHGHGHHDDHGHGHHNGSTGVHIGAVRYASTLWPQIDVPIPVAGFFIKLLVFLIEVVGVIVRNAVLAVRLFANMFAGHMVLATILLFIRMAANVNPALWGTITLSSVFGILALSLLEIFVAFLQAYIFTFLTSLFMGMAITPQH